MIVDDIGVVGGGNDDDAVVDVVGVKTGTVSNVVVVLSCMSVAGVDCEFVADDKSTQLLDRTVNLNTTLCTAKIVEL